MRKIFCDGCNEELREASSPDYITLPGEVYFTGVYSQNYAEIVWCRSCTMIAIGAVRTAKDDIA